MEPNNNDDAARRTVPTARLLAALAAVGAALVLAACGGGGSSDSTSTAAQAADGGQSSANSEKAVKYSQCMREHGVTNFPDPKNGRLTLRAGPGSGIDPNSATFKSAQDACQSLAPSGAQVAGGGDAVRDSVLKFARCMRENGVPGFPDPQVSGGRVTMQPGAGVDPNSAAYKAAQSKCSPLLSGATQGSAP